MLSHTAQSIKLLKKDFPPGISRIVLYDEDFKPHCERLVYVDPPPVQVNVESDKKIYTPNSKTRLRVNIMDETGASLPSELSVSAVDLDAINIDFTNSSHIRSYYYLESELRGRIETPGYYFNLSNDDRLRKLDLLLMTQGWRDFIWKYVADTTFETVYPAEKGLTISGRFFNLTGTKPMMDASISLSLMGRERNFYGTSLTDRTGNYSFRDLNIQGLERVLLSGVDKRGRTRGRIFLDSIIYPEVSVNYRWNPTTLHEKDATKDYLDDARTKSNLMKKYRLSDTIPIEEVKVTARWRPGDDGHQRIFTKADNVVEVKEHERLFRDIFELLQGRVPGVVVTGFAPDYQVIIRGVNNLRGEVEPLYLLDGLPVSREFLVDLPVRTVDRIEVLKDISNLAMYGSRGANGVIIVYSKKEIDPLDPPPVQHAINTEIRGYHVPRIFYAPRYDRPRPERRVPDLRNTIYWEPNVKIGKNGRGEIEYFNSDVPTKILVTLEGITEDGIPLYQTILYEVD